jgi:hypothetical protein
MLRLYLTHLQALKGQIHTVDYQCVVESPTLTISQLYNNESLRLTLEGLKMTLVESKHVAILM